MQSCVILMYHVIDEPGNRVEAQFCCTPERFREQMRHLREAGYSPIPVSRLADWVSGGAALPDNAVCVTFDDGPASLYENALPVLREFDIPATSFVIAERIGGYNDWQVAEGCPRRRLLSRDEILELHRNQVEVGSHSSSHCFLPAASPEQIRREVAGSKAQIEDLLGIEVCGFAYPFGGVTEAARDAVAEAGYRFACSTEPGKNRPTTNRFLLRRVEVYNWDQLWEYRLKVRFGTTHARPGKPLARQMARGALRALGLRRDAYV